jgi:uncharacterized protein YjbJ (UPF0337 family)
MFNANHRMTRHDSRLKVTDQWGRLTERDLDRLALEREPLVSVVQRKYGYTRQRAELEVDHFLQLISSGDSIPGGKGEIA